MAELKFTKGTDQEHKIKLESSLISAVWSSGQAYAGYPAKFRVQTAFVGNGASIQLTGKSAKGKKLGKVKGKINNNIFVGKFDLPEDIELGDEIFFEVKLSSNGLSGESETMPVFPPPRIKKLEWSSKEARRGDILTLSGEFKDIPDNSEVLITIYEYDNDKAHDKITEFPAVLDGKKLEAKWKYEYHEDTDEIATREEKEKYGGSYNPPEYFFTVKFDDFELGKEQESGLLEFKDYIEITLKDSGGNPVPDADFVLYLPDGSEKKGKLDADGYARVEDVPPGSVRVEFPDLDQVDNSDSDTDRDV